MRTGQTQVRISHNVALVKMHVQEGRYQGEILVYEAGGHENNLKNGGNFRAEAS
jgi:hypothetical protein